MVEKRLLLTAALLATGATCGRPVARLDTAVAPMSNYDGGDRPIARILGYSARMWFDGKDHFANFFLVYRNTPFSDQYLCILRVAWKEGGAVVNIQFAPDYGEESFYHDVQHRTVLPYDKKMENVMVATRWVKDGEMRFLERGLIESLPLAPKKVGNFEVLSTAEPLWFRVLTYGTCSGDVVGFIRDDYILDEFREQNPGYAKIMRDFRSALAWVFPDWLAEDGYKVDKKWLAQMRKDFPKARLDQ